MKNVLRINSIDNLVIALEDLKEGQIISDGDKHIELLEDVKAGHKIACKDIYKGEHLLRYGNSIGRATKDIEMGEWIHTHNLSTNLSGKLEYRYTPNHRRLASRKGPTSFKGYKRKNGSVGIRNELWIIPTVGCVNGVAEEIIREFKLKNQIDYSNIDNIQVYKHNFGCSQLGDDHKNTRTLLVDMVKHPNAGGVLVLGLGCENNTIDEFKKALGKYDPERTKFLITQDVADEIQEGLLLLADLYESMKDDVREELALSELKIGLKCGASDGFSGITANPLLGELSNYLVSHGGTTILTEVPE
ncbi:MAG: UxaA family hydrolase, partial [Tissierellaceae bacterium]